MPRRFAASASGANRLIGEDGISSALSEIFGIFLNYIGVLMALV